MLGQNNPVFGMLSSVISGCSGKGTALDSGAGLSVHQRGEVVCNRSSWVLRFGCWGDPPAPHPPGAGGAAGAVLAEGLPAQRMPNLCIWLQ